MCQQGPAGCFPLTVTPAFTNNRRMKRIKRTLSILCWLLLMGAPVSATTGNVPPAPAAEELSLPPIYIEKVSTLGNGQTLSDLLIGEGLPGDQVYTALGSLAKKYSLRGLPVGQKVAFLYKEDDAGTATSLEGLFFNTRDDKSVKVSRTNDSYQCQVTDRVLFGRKAVARGEITSSLFEAANEAGLPDGLVIPYVELFAWDLDFTRDIRTGDKFEVIFEQMFDNDGNLVRNGDVLAARFIGKVGTYEAFRADDGNYYNRDGISKERMLIRTPLKFTRISSRFNPSRKHPILGYTRAHKGTDFAAPRGTPVKAAGTGRIEEIGWKGGYGKYIRIRHNGVYQTAYAHLHNFARNMRSGRRVRQGEVIGYVGTTGRSTGPHLHYEVIYYGKQVDALTVKLPNGNPLEAQYKSQFDESVAEAENLWQENAQNTASQ